MEKITLKSSVLFYLFINLVFLCGLIFGAAVATMTTLSVVTDCSAQDANTKTTEVSND